MRLAYNRKLILLHGHQHGVRRLQRGTGILFQGGRYCICALVVKARVLEIHSMPCGVS